MRALFLLLIVSIACSSALNAQVAGCNELFFSEYIEGSGTNKCLEIYNPTSSTVSLNGYQIRMYFNGAIAAGLTITLPTSASIPPYGVYTVCNLLTFYPDADLINTSGWYNGDDAVELVKSGTPIDRIGVVGVDPGTNWPVGTGATSEFTLVRKASVTQGSLVWTGSGDTEWDVYAQNTSSFLGSHTSNCFVAGPCSITEISREDNTGSCDNNGTPYIDDDTYITSISVAFSGAPSSGFLKLEIDGITLDSVLADLLSGGDYAFDNLILPANGQPLVITARFTDGSSCLLTENLGPNQASCSSLTPCSYLFFSEYTEGTGFNKCIEIFNPTNGPINLATYGVFVSFNGGTSDVTLPLSGTIPSGGTFVLCDDGAAAEFLQAADQTTTSNLWNGNDVILLEDANGVIDAIGQLGNAANYGENVTLRRKFSVTFGDNNPNDAFTTASWDAYPVNTFWGLGYHANSCKSLLPSGWNPFNVGCPTGTVSHSGGQFTLSSNCYEDLSSGVDEHTLAFQELCGDGEIITRICGITGLGFAGLTFRESANANSKQVSLLFQNSQNAHWFTRSVTGGSMQFQSKPRLNRSWLRVTRTGDVFRGYISANGTAWQLLFQSQIAMADCMFVGLITESNVDGANTTANFCNVQFIDPNFFVRPINDGPVETNMQLLAQDQDNGEFEFPATAELFDNNNGSELAIRPNPVVNELEVVIPGNLQAGALLHIVDLNGRKLFTERIGEGSNLMMLNLAELNLSAGVYLLNVQDGATVLTKRFVKVN